MLKQITFLSLLFSSTVWAEQIPSNVHISVFTTEAYPIKNNTLAHAIYSLDSVEHWENKFSQTLSNDPIQAEQQAKALFQSVETQKQLNALQEQYQNIIQGWQNGIRKVPAILFDSPQYGKSVVYGEIDVQKAITYWEHWIEQQER